MPIFGDSKNLSMTRNIVLCLAIYCLSLSAVIAQTDYNKVPEVTSKILLNDVYIFQTASDSLGLGDILFEDGIIKQIAAEIEAPYDAKIIEGDSAYVYPAFIDALSHTAIPKPERESRSPNVKFPGYPPNDLAGITPQLKASDMLDPEDKSIEALNKQGFAIAHIVPRGRMLPGKGCIALLNGDSAEEMIMHDESSSFFQLAGARRVYPSTVIAVMSKWRDLYRNAEIYASNHELYNQSPQGTNRPKVDIELEALVPVTKKDQAVFAISRTAKEVYRQMELQKELGYNMVLTDVKQADPAIEALKSGNVHMALSLDLPDKKKKKDKGEKDEDEEVKDPVREALVQKRDQSLAQYESQAARLESENIDFAFSTNSVKAKDIKKNLKRMVDAGLSEETAMDALTINAAELLGIQNVTGSLHEGKLANMIVCTEAYFNEDAAIKYLFVEGDMTEYEIKKKESKSEGKIDEAILGTWSFEVDVMGEINRGTIEITQSDDELEVSITDNSAPGEPIECTDISFEEGTFRCSLTVDADGVELPVNLVLEMESDSYSGTATIADMGSFPIEGSKISSPENQMK